MQGLGGTSPGLSRGATMSGNKAGGASDPSPIKLLQAGPDFTGSSGASVTFTAPKPGLYQFAAWGGGGVGGGGAGAGGGSLAIRTVRLSLSQQVPIVVASSGGSSTCPATTVTFTDGVMTAGTGINAASTGLGGVASGGDINVNGADASGTNGGAGATYGGFTGGGGATGVVNGSTPGGGGSAANVTGAAGLVVVTYVGL